MVKIVGPVGRTGKLTGYVNAVRNFQPSARVTAAMTPPITSTAPAPAYNPHAYVPGGSSPAVATAIQTKGLATARPAVVAAGRGTGGNKKTTVQTTQDMLQQITNRYIASLQTPAQQAAQQNAWINASQAASAASINAAYDQQKKDLLQQQARANQYAMALGSLRDMSGLQANADYTNAARNIQGLGTGLTGTVADAQQAEANQSAQQIAAATQGLGQAQGLDVAGMRNIAQYTGVTQPATNLYEEAASQAAQARLNQDVRAQQVENLATGYGTQIGSVASQRAADLAKLAATRPSLYQQAMQQAQSGNRSDLATIISALALQNQTAKTPSEITKNKAEAGAATTRAGAATTNAATGAAKVTGVTKDGKLVGGYYWAGPGSTAPTKIPSGHHIYEGDATGHILVPDQPYYWAGKGLTNPTLIPKNYMLDPNDPTHHKIIKNPNAFAPKAPAVESPAQKTKRIQGLINTWTTNIGKMQTQYAHDIADPYEVKQGYAKSHWVPRMSYAAAYADIVKKLPPDIKKSPQMKAIIDDFLRTNGYKITTTKTKTKAGTKTTKTIKPPSAADLLGNKPRP